MALSRPEFQKIIKKVWDKRLYGVEQFQLCRRLKSLKQPLKQLNVKEFSHISSRAERARSDLDEIQALLQNDPMNSDLLASVSACTLKTGFICEAERSFIAQKAKCKYLKNADRCNKFFYGIVKKNYKKNFIASVGKADGNMTESEEEVAQEFINSFLYWSSGSLKG